ncbi:hypothetical protein ACFQMA_10305 [Halosimplex aquaticum]|uniref:AI-2E family transporter n=1 Tax=Halosimplex aquaticum TaxID=3026162 RepID=A0ABD5XZY4_9EURY|nr:hypothetical protein [Halosimplex aquaticum]
MNATAMRFAAVATAVASLGLFAYMVLIPGTLLGAVFAALVPVVVYMALRYLSLDDGRGGLLS